MLPAGDQPHEVERGHRHRHVRGLVAGRAHRDAGPVEHQQVALRGSPGHVDLELDDPLHGGERLGQRELAEPREHQPHRALPHVRHRDQPTHLPVVQVVHEHHDHLGLLGGEELLDLGRRQVDEVESQSGGGVAWRHCRRLRRGGRGTPLS